MAIRTQTYLTEDWKIWTYVPESNSFVLDFSKLNGTDTLGYANGSMVVSDSQVTGINLNEGGVVTSAIFTDVAPASISISLIIKNFSSYMARNYLVGTAIWVTYKNAEDIPDNNFSLNTPIFIGRIRSFNVDIQPGSDFASVTIEATSDTEDDLNVLMSILKDNIVYKTEAIAASATTLGIDTSFYPSTLHFGGTAVGVYETKTYGEWLADLVLCNLDVVRDDVTATGVFYTSLTRQYNYSNGIKTTTSNGSAITSKATFDENIITDVELNWDGAGAPTGVTLTNDYNNTIVYQYGSTSSSSTGGAFNFAATVDVKDITEMTSVGQRMISYGREFAPVSVAVKLATNYQDIDFANEYLLDQGSTYREAWLYPANLLRIGDVAEITVSAYGFTDYRAIITGRTITVTPDDWTVTYNLWKGF